MRTLICCTLATGFATALLASAALANDTTLNVNVNPPRQLSELELPVRMAAEQITVHFGREQCSVEVEFSFENLSDDAVYCTAGFPDEDLLTRYAYYAGPDSSGRLPDERFPGINEGGDYDARGLDDASVLTDFKAWSRPAGTEPSMNAPLETTLLRIERIAYEPGALASLGGEWKQSELMGTSSLMFCRSFPLVLEPHEKRVIGHSYTTLSGSNVESQSLFSYTLGTGRSWAGSIGRAQIDVYLADGLTAADLNFANTPDSYGATCNPPQTDWKELEAGHLRAVWEDFEPGGERSYIMLATKPVAH